MNLIDDAELLGASIFDALSGEAPYDEMWAFDWDAEFEAAAELPEPWQWEWKTPLRALQQQLIGTPDVTGWTAGAGAALAELLSAPPELHPTLLGFREAETGLLPAVDAATETVSAEGAERPLPPL